MQAIKTSNKGFLERVFRLSECNTNVKTEIIAGQATPPAQLQVHF